MKQKRIFFFHFLLFLITIECNPLNKLLGTLSQSQYNQTRYELPQEWSSGKCKICQQTVKKIQDMFISTSGILSKFYKKLLIGICRLQNTKIVCENLINQMEPYLVSSIIINIVDGQKICPNLFLCPKIYKKETVNDFIRKLNKVQPNPENITSKKSFKKVDVRNLRVIHLTDIHVDYEYEYDSLSTCSEPLCCRKDSKQDPKQKTQKAGFWGTSGKCDIPYRSIEQLVKFIKEKVKPDIIVWTGDTISHDIWEQHKEKQIFPTLNITQLLLEELKGSNTKILPIFGNHESYPVNVYDFFSDRENPVLRKLADAWIPILGKETADFFAKNGYYSKYIEEYNLRVISINTQACHSLNWFLLKNPSDPGNMLKFLIKELRYAEANEENVYIIGHIPPGDECVTRWSRRYRAIIERFSNIIKMQFYGHTHYDHFQIIRSVDKPHKPKGIILISPSVTTFCGGYKCGLNPSFRLYNVSLQNMQPQNYYQYRLDLQKWNNRSRTERLEWDIAYNFLEEYNVTNMSPESFEQLATQLSSNTTYLKKYIKNYYTGSQNSIEYYQKFYRPVKFIKNNLEQLFQKSSKKFICETLEERGLINNCKQPDISSFIDQIGYKILETLQGNWLVPINEEL